jgi:methanogenic corrinoid protein MtbC1
MIYNEWIHPKVGERSSNMSLLNVDESMSALARQVFDRQFEIDPGLQWEYDDRQKRLMYQDIVYNLSFLKTAMQFNDDQIFLNYAVWIYQLLCYLTRNVGRERIKDRMVLHYRLLDEALGQVLPVPEAQKASQHLENAMRATEHESVHFSPPQHWVSTSYPEIKQEYLALVLKNDTRGALAVIERAARSGIPLTEIYLKILQEVMYEVGSLWHQNLITVDKEHYITSTTQMALAQFFPMIFSAPRKQFKVLTCCVGSELHEMGVRMVSDLFEYHGWESIYLGAAVPKEAILNAIEENTPHLVALSVTMVQHLPLCFETVNAIREEYPKLKIAVGGQAFQRTNALWKQWDVDVYTENAQQLVEWAEGQAAVWEKA